MGQTYTLTTLQVTIRWIAKIIMYMGMDHVIWIEFELTVNESEMIAHSVLIL